MESFIGKLVTSGYMVSFHEGLVYLHDTLGKRWAEMDIGGVTIKATFYTTNTTHHVEDMRELLALEEME